MEIRQFRFTMTGTTALIHNNPVNIGVDKGRDPLAWEREHFMEKVYFDATKSHAVVTAPAIRKAAINACKFLTDKPKARAFKSYGPLVEAALLVEADAPVSVSLDKIIPDVRIVGLDPSKGSRGPRGPRVRPLIPLPWQAETTIVIVDDAITDDALDRILEAAGRLIGVHDGRAIGHGRFMSRVVRI